MVILNCHLLVVGLLSTAVLAISVRGEVPKDARDSVTAFVRQQHEPQTHQREYISLGEALRRPDVGRIVVVGNYTVHKELDGPSLLLNRNLIITGDQGKNTVLDLQYNRSAVVIASNASVTLTNITVANERRGAGKQYDIFVGQPGSKVIARDTYKLRLACVNSSHQAYAVSQTPRSTLFPGQHGNQSFSLLTVPFQGQIYEDMLKMTNYTADVPLTVQEGAPAAGGYALSESNSVRLCQHTVPEECLVKFSSDYCVNRMIDDIEGGAQPMQDASRGPANDHEFHKSNPTVTAVAALIGAFGALALLGLAVWLYKRCCCRPKPGMLVTKGCTSGKTSVGKPSSRNTEDITDDIEAGIDQELRVESEVWQPAGIRKGWEVSYCMTTPLLGSADEDEKIQFVRLLGAGSFGRVYLAKWAGRQCAVKVISHGADTAQLVENEVALMMSFNHPNVVKAYRCITYSHAPSTQERDSRGTGSCSPTDSLTAASSISSPGAADSPSRGLMKAVGIIRKQGTAPQPLDQVAIDLGNPVTAADSGRDRDGTTAPACSTIARTRSSSLTSTSPMQVTNTSASQSVAIDVMEMHLASGHCSTNGNRKGQAARAGEVIPADGSRCNTLPMECEGSDGFQYQATDLGSTDIEEESRVETWLLLEYCDSGTLSNLVSRWQAPPDSDERLIRLLVLLQDAAHGLKELHKANVVHGDLNARNVMVSSSSTASYGHVAKISDLGLSRTVKQHETHRTTNTVGTMSHMPPELLRYGWMSSAADVYAFGVMMWELYTGQQAFKKLHYGQFFDIVVRHNLRPAIPDHMPSDYRTLMEHCWATEAADRPTCESIVECLDYMVEQRKLLLQSTAAYRGLSSAAGPVRGSDWMTDGQQRPASFSARSTAAAGQMQAVYGCPAADSSIHDGNSLVAEAAASGCPGAVSHAGMKSTAAAAAAAAWGENGDVDSSLQRDQQARKHDGNNFSFTPRRKPGLLSQPVPVRRPRYSFGSYSSAATAAAACGAAAAAASAAGSVPCVEDARQLYLPIDEASATIPSPAAATPNWIRGPFSMQQQHRASHTSAVGACTAAEPAAAIAEEKCHNSMGKSPPNHWAGALPLFRTQTAADFKRPSLRMSVDSNAVAPSEASCQLSEPLPMSFTAQRENSQLLKRFWFV